MLTDSFQYTGVISLLKGIADIFKSTLLTDKQVHSFNCYKADKGDWFIVVTYQYKE